MGGNLVLLILILAPFEGANHAETDWDSQTNEQQLLGRRLIVVTLPLLINKWLDASVSSAYSIPQ